MSRNKVSTMRQLQNRSEELKQQGYVAVRPGEFTSPSHGDGAKPMSWASYLNSQLTTAQAANGETARKQISTIFSSGGENTAQTSKIGTDGLGFMDWGINNRLPNIVWLCTQLSPFTAAGFDFIMKIIAGRGPVPKYHYTQYVGGNVTEKFIPYETAGTLLRGQIADLKAKATVPEGEPSGIYDQEIADLQAALDTWKKSNEEIKQFCRDNDLMQIYLNLSGDMALLSQCFVELQLNQRQLDPDTKKAVPTEQWTPKVIGIKYRPAMTTRLERMDSQYRINYAYYSNQWLDPSMSGHNNIKEEDTRISAVPYLRLETAYHDLEGTVRKARQQKVARKDRPTRFCISPRTYGGPYYASTSWHSIFAGSIYEYAFTIVDDRLTRKRNSNIIGRVIYIHQDYLNALFRQQGESDKKKTMAQLQTEVFDDINTWLANPDNAGQALISSVFTGPDGKEHKAWEIVEIETKANSQAQAEKTELQEISSIIFFAMGLDSKLIGNTPGDATSSGGTDLRERFLVKQIQFAPLQQLMLRPLEVISRFNEWDEHLVWQIDREVLTTLDNSKTGVTRQGQE